MHTCVVRDTCLHLIINQTKYENDNIRNSTRNTRNGGKRVHVFYRRPRAGMHCDCNMGIRNRIRDDCNIDQHQPDMLVCNARLRSDLPCLRLYQGIAHRPCFIRNKRLGINNRISKQKLTPAGKVPVNDMKRKQPTMSQRSLGGGDFAPPNIQRLLDAKRLEKQKSCPRCEVCGRKLNPQHTVWLELGVFSGYYWEPKDFPKDDESQGCFPFGIECWKKKLQENPFYQEKEQLTRLK